MALEVISAQEDEEIILNSEIEALENEFRWVIKNEVHNVLRDLSATLRECVMKFPMSLCGVDKALETEKYVLNTPSTTPADQVKVVVAMCGENITQADINLKLPRPGKDLYQNSNIREDLPWRLNQVQDAGNQLQLAMSALESIEKDYQFKTSAEVDSFLSRVLACLQRSRSALVNPKKRTLEELHSSKQIKALQPPLPPELALSFYLQGYKLVFGVYHIITDKGTSKFNRYQAECVIPWINEVLVMLTVSMQMVQQLRDKVNVFSQFADVNLSATSDVTNDA